MVKQKQPREFSQGCFFNSINSVNKKVVKNKNWVEGVLRFILLKLVIMLSPRNGGGLGNKLLKRRNKESRD
jgi:hypothetical protein